MAKRNRRGQFTRKSTRKGSPRRTARLAYSRKPQGRVRRVQTRRPARATARRRNPEMFSAPVRYALAAGAGAAASALWADAAPMLNPTKEDGSPMLPVSGGVVAGGITWLAAQFLIKGARNKNLARAAAVGMALPAATAALSNAVAGMTDNGNDVVTGERAFRLRGGASAPRLSAPVSRSAANFVQASNLNLAN